KGLGGENEKPDGHTKLLIWNLSWSINELDGQGLRGQWLKFSMAQEGPRASGRAS
ncbi:unnamed protein product, partial [Discosporangium mesarthrocarpum]